uniref:Uncharacterized protein n=1 Tax=Prolemur simus TaxID=1328070 RepID=A0A8C9A1C3_PROSS
MQEVEQDRHRAVLGPASLNSVAWQSDPQLPSPEGSGSSLPHFYFPLPHKLGDMGNNPTFQGGHETRGFLLFSVIYKGK